jgi:thymidylate synthase
MNKLDKQYTDLLQDILDNGVKKEDRTRTGTISVFGRQIRHKMSDGFPLLTTKKMAFKTMVTELLWFLKGDTNIKYLVDNNCHIWDGDCYQAYLKKVIRDKDIVRYLKSYSVDTSGVPTIEPYSKDEFIERIKNDDVFAKKWGELGPIYGKMWREFDEDSGGIDQIAILINELKTNPDSRRLMVTAWHPGYNQHSVLPPCHYGFQVYTRELDETERVVLMDKKLGITENLPQYYTEDEMIKYNIPTQYYTEDEMIKYNIPKRAISLMWNQRSVDTFLGLPFNIASYGLLLEIIAKEVNMIPDELIGNLGDVHLYSNHIEQAKEQIGRTLTFDERYKIYSKSDKTWEEGGGNAYGKITALDMMDDDGIPTRTREPYPLPKLQFNPIFLANLEHKSFDEAVNGQVNFELENYQSHPAIKAPLSN